uniref:Uncharacterized protein n=1 Tax=Rhizophora mucronata TaxID=61149 RepID=A0A2P2QBM7_RHIMU
MVDLDNWKKKGKPAKFVVVLTKKIPKLCDPKTLVNL